MTLDDHKIKMMRYLDNEMERDEREEFEVHIAGCATCREHMRELNMVKEVTDTVKMADLPEKVWDTYWTGVYNRLERSVAWFFFIVGSLILIHYGIYEALTDPGVDSVVRLGMILLLIGFAILFLSVVREKLAVNSKDRYISEVDR